MDMDILRRRLTSDEINDLPLYHYTGPVLVIRSLNDWKQALPDLQDENLLGFDTETRPSFRKGRRNAPALIQLATARSVYLVQLANLPFGAPVAGNSGQSLPGQGRGGHWRRYARPGPVARF